MPRTSTLTARPNPFAEAEHEPPEPTAPPPASAEEQAGRRLLEFHGPGLLDACRAEIAALTTSLEGDHSDPYGSHFDQYRDNLFGYVYEKRPPIKLRHELLARLAGLEALLAGRPWMPVDGPRIEAAVARDLITLFVWGSRIKNPAEVLLTALAIRIQRLGAELAQAREYLSDERLSRWCTLNPDPATWTRLEGLYHSETELAGRFARLCAARDRFTPALAAHVTAAIDAAGGTSAVCSGLAQSAPPPALPPIEADPEVAALAAEVAAANQNADDWAIAAARHGGDAPTRLEELRETLTREAEAKLAARRSLLRRQRTDAEARVPLAYMPTVEAARAGDGAGWWELVSAARAKPAVFAEGFGDRLVEALLASLNEAGAVEFCQAISPPTD